MATRKPTIRFFLEQPSHAAGIGQKKSVRWDEGVTSPKARARARKQQTELELLTLDTLDVGLHAIEKDLRDPRCHVPGPNEPVKLVNYEMRFNNISIPHNLRCVHKRFRDAHYLKRLAVLKREEARKQAYEASVRIKRAEMAIAAAGDLYNKACQAMPKTPKALDAIDLCADKLAHFKIPDEGLPLTQPMPTARNT